MLEDKVINAANQSFFKSFECEKEKNSNFQSIGEKAGDKLRLGWVVGQVAEGGQTKFAKKLSIKIY